jgi:hypothetical protein
MRAQDGRAFMRARVRRAYMRVDTGRAGSLSIVWGTCAHITGAQQTAGIYRRHARTGRRARIHARKYLRASARRYYLTRRQSGIVWGTCAQITGAQQCAADYRHLRRCTMNHEAGYAMVCCAYMRVDTGRAGSLGGQYLGNLGDMRADHRRAGNIRKFLEIYRQLVAQ